MQSRSLLRGKYSFRGKYPRIHACSACVTRTPIVLTQYFCLAYSRRAPCVLLVAGRTQRKTGRPVFLLRAVRRVSDHQKTYFAPASIALLGPFFARRPHVIARTTGCKRCFKSSLLLQWFHTSSKEPQL